MEGFWAAFFGPLIVGVVSWLLTAFLSDRGRVVVVTERADLLFWQNPTPMMPGPLVPGRSGR